MTLWIRRWNNKIFDLVGAYNNKENKSEVEWNQYNHYDENDIVFIYDTQNKFVRYIFQVTKVDITSEHLKNNIRDGLKYWIDKKSYYERKRKNRWVMLKKIYEIKAQITLDKIGINKYFVRCTRLNKENQDKLKILAPGIFDFLKTKNYL